nr:MAG TPA: hypothetical protein [Caudoviricetes sp.]
MLFLLVSTYHFFTYSFFIDTYSFCCYSNKFTVFQYLYQLL